MHLGGERHNTMFPAKARTRSARSGVERTNHEATAPPLKLMVAELEVIKKDSRVYLP